MSNYRKDRVTLSYNKAQRDFVVSYPRVADGNLILNKIIGDHLLFNLNKQAEGNYYAFDIFNLKEELEKRGYDITTLKFSIDLKK